MSDHRAITRSVLLRPRYRRGRWRVAGPDEDALTLTVQALERLVPEAPPVASPSRWRLHLVGTSTGLADASVVSATGWEDLEVRRHPASSDGALAALEASTRPSERDTVELIVAVDTPVAGEMERGTATVGLRVEREPGLELGEHLHLSIHDARERNPPWVLHRAASVLGPPSEPVRALWLRFPGDVQAGWEELWAPRAIRGGWEANLPLPDLGAAPATGLLALVHRAQRSWAAGTRGVVGTVEDSAVTMVALHAASGGAVTTDPPGDDPGLLLPLPESSTVSPASLDAVSEGAYVPRATYLENLAARWRLVAESCSHCGAVTFPPRGRCRSCGRADQLRSVPLSRKGLSVATVTTIAPGAQPTEFDPQVSLLGSYSVVVADLAPGVRVTAQVTDAVAGAIVVGDRVDLELRRLYPMEGEWRYGLKAVPAQAGPT
jgi:uncharacterized OB-fold protein